MIFFPYLQYAIWLSMTVALLLIPVLLKRTGRLQQYPIFAIYVLFVALHGILLVFMKQWGAVPYFYTYYAGTFCSIALSFLVLFEASKSALSFPAFRMRKSQFLQLCAACSLVALVVVSVTDPHEKALILRARVSIEEFLRVVQLGVLGIFLLATRFFGLYWRRMEFGIVGGYGIYAVIELSALVTRAVWGEETMMVFVLAKALSFSAAVVIWTTYACFKEQAYPVQDDEIPLAKFREALAFADRNIR